MRTREELLHKNGFYLNKFIYSLFMYRRKGYLFASSNFFDVRKLLATALLPIWVEDQSEVITVISAALIMRFQIKKKSTALIISLYDILSSIFYIMFFNERKRSFLPLSPPFPGTWQVACRLKSFS